MPMPADNYVAGVCNIGQAEIAGRRAFGWVMLGVALVLVAALATAGSARWWRLFVFFPATLSATGFLQAHFHFCVGFARRGIFNFDAIGHTHAVTDDAEKAKDRVSGARIMRYSVVIGAAAAVVAVAIGS